MSFYGTEQIWLGERESQDSRREKDRHKLSQAPQGPPIYTPSPYILPPKPTLIQAPDGLRNEFPESPWTHEHWRTRKHLPPLTMPSHGPVMSTPPQFHRSWPNNAGDPHHTGQTYDPWVRTSDRRPSYGLPPSNILPGSVMVPDTPVYGKLENNERPFSEQTVVHRDSCGSRHSTDSHLVETSPVRNSASPRKSQAKRSSSNRDEFDKPHQYLAAPSRELVISQDRDLPSLPVNLVAGEQDEILNKVHDFLSQCAFDFVAKYQFPIPLEADKRVVTAPSDREWNEWVQLLKRLATKRRIPARVLYNGQIKQFVTVMENSLEMRHAAKHQSRPLKDDRNVLQLISAGIQVAKILKDAPAMEALDQLYTDTEGLILQRKSEAALVPRSNNTS